MGEGGTAGERNKDRKRDREKERKKHILRFTVLEV
jgi:hypothetical protein